MGSPCNDLPYKSKVGLERRMLSDLPVPAVALIVFVAQFIFIALKGVQQITVVAGRFWVAGITSLGLGVSGLVTLDILANALVKGAHWFVLVCYLAGGVLGILSAMWLEGRRKKRARRHGHGLAHFDRIVWWRR